MRITSAVAVLVVAGAIASGAGANAAAVRPCAAKSVGPGSIQRGGTAGATCMLAAFRGNCDAAYALSSFGVDTVRTEAFRMSRGSAGCTVYVTETFRVVPQQPHVLTRLMCGRLRKTAAGDVVADRCTPKRTVSLTKL